MEQRPLGSTGMTLSKLGFGSSPLGGVYGPVDEVDAVDAVHKALDLGITYFDTSPYYGLGQSEIVLGKALKGIERDRYVLSTKVGRYGDEAFDFSSARVRSSVEESCQRLGIDSLDLVFCHDIEFAQSIEEIESAIAELTDMKVSGKVRAIGVSGLPLSILRQATEMFEIDAVLSYCHYTLLDTTLLDFLPELEKRQIGVINASPLAMGLLTKKGPPEWHPASEPLRRACAEAVRLCGEFGHTIERVALSFSLELRRCSSTLIGMATPFEVQQNFEAENGDSVTEFTQRLMNVFASQHGRT